MKTPDQVIIPEIADESCLDLYQGVRIDKLLEQVETEVNSIVGLDPADKKNNAAIGSIGRKISSFKTALDSKGKQIVEPMQKQIAEVQAARKKVRDRCDRLRADWLRPRDEYEREVAANAKAVADAFELWQYGASKVGEFKSEPTFADFEDMKQRMEDAGEGTSDVFGDRLPEAIRAQEAGLAALQQRLDQWRDDQRIKEAGRKALEAEKAAARQADIKAEAEKLAAKQAKQPQQAASAAPQQPRAEYMGPQCSEYAAETHRAILKAFIVQFGMTEDQGKALVTEIVRGNVPGLRVDYGKAAK